MKSELYDEYESEAMMNINYNNFISADTKPTRLLGLTDANDICSYSGDINAEVKKDIDKLKEEINKLKLLIQERISND